MFFGLALAALSWPYGTMDGLLEDEALALSNGLLMAQGQVIYRDFFEFMAPFCHQLAGLLAGALGGGDAYLEAAKWGTAVLTAWTALGLAWAARGLGATWPWAALPAVGYWAGVHRAWPGFGHHAWAWPWLVGALLLASLALCHPSGQARWRWFFCGWFAAWGALTTQLEGLLVVISLLGAVVLGAWGRGLGLRWGAQILLLGLAGALGGGLVVLGPLLWQGAGPQLWADLVLFPLSAYRQPGGVNDVAWGSDLVARLQPFEPQLGWHARAWTTLAWYALLPTMALGAFAYLAGLAWRRIAQAQPMAAHQAAALPWLLAAVLALPLGTRGKADFVHVLLVAPPALVLAAWVASAGWRQFASELRPWGERLVAAGPGVAYLCWCVCLLGLMAKTAKAEAWYASEGLGARFRGAPDLQWLRHHAKPGDGVLGLPYSGRYILAGHRVPSRFRLMMPPSAGYNPPEQWAKFRSELRQTRPRFVLISAAPALPGGWSAWLEALPPGYHWVATLPPLHAGWGPCRVYQGQPTLPPP